LIVALLFKEGGALEVQTTIHKALSHGNSDLFFIHVRSMLHDLMNWHKWHGVIDTRDPTSGEEGEVELPDNIILVRMLQLMCEGHYLPNQDIIRDQPNNIIKVNLLDDFVEYLQVLDDMKCRTSTDAATKVADVILEVIQGPCVENQNHFALSTELLETLNRRMRNRVIEDMKVDEENGMKKTAIDIFQGLLEGQGHRTAVYDRVLSVIHLDVIQMMCQPDDTEESSNNVVDDDEESDPEEDESAQELRTESLVLLQMLFDYKPEIRNELNMQEDAMDEDSGVACVELVWNGELQRRFFSVPEICRDIAKSSKDAFVTGCDRESPEGKLHALIAIAKSMYRETLHQQVLKQLKIAWVFSKTNQDRATLLCFLIALTINLLFVFNYTNEICTPGFEWADDDESFEYPECLKRRLPNDANGVDVYVLVQILGIFLIFTAAYSVLLCLVVRMPVLYEGYTEQQYLKTFYGIKLEPTWYWSLLYTLFDGPTLYNTSYLLFAVLSVQTDYHHLATFLLLDIVRLSPVTQDTLNAIWMPRKMLFMTVLLTFILVYVYAVFAFFTFNDEDNFTYALSTHTLVNAFKEFLRYGSPSGSLNNDMVQTVHTYRWIFDVTFFMMCFTMWNVIKGITIDTFVELRQELELRLEDTEEKCFVCGIDKLTFNRALDRNAFDDHIQRDQNMWNYVYYCIFIWEQDKDDDDGLEYYVRHCIDDGDLSWFPMNKAIRMSEHLEAGDSGSLPHMFRGNLQKLEIDMDARMTALKDTAIRSITRVEQALIYQPEDKTVKKMRKEPTKLNDNIGNDDSTAMTNGSDSLLASFRPTTGSTAAAFLAQTASPLDIDGNPRPMTATEKLIVGSIKRAEALDTALSEAYMDSCFLKIAIVELNDLLITPAMSSSIHIRIVSDTSHYIRKTVSSSSSSTTTTTNNNNNKNNNVVNIGSEETKGENNNKLHKSEPLLFNSSEFLVIHSGILSNNNEKEILLQILYDRPIHVPSNDFNHIIIEENDKNKKVTQIALTERPSSCMKFICGVSMSLSSLIQASTTTNSGEGQIVVNIPQDNNGDVAYILLNVQASPELLLDYKKTQL
jgi:hypothetical protein